MVGEERKEGAEEAKFGFGPNERASEREESTSARHQRQIGNIVMSFA